MPKFLMLTLRGGDPCIVSVEHIVTLTGRGDDATAVLTLINGRTVYATETLWQVMDAIDWRDINA